MAAPPPPPPWDAPRLQATASAYWQACALHAATRTGLLAALAQGPASAAELAHLLEADLRGVTILLTALEALGLVRLEGEAYSLDDQAAPFVTPGSPKDLTHAILHMADMVPDWAKLTQCVKEGKPVERTKPADGSAPGRTHFYRAMRDIARQQAPGLAARLGLKPGMSLLDLAGGPGVYALTFADEIKGLQCSVFDLPESRPFFAEEAARHPGAGRVGFIEGDYDQAPLGGPYDVVWLSQVLHGEGPLACQALLDKAAAALKSGGLLWVQEFVVRPGVHPWPALFSLNMLVNTDVGQSYDEGQLLAMLSRAGLKPVEFAGPTREGGPAALVRGWRPA
jgi:hypothetical protein